MDGELQQLAEGSMLQGDLDFGRKMWDHCEALTSGTLRLEKAKYCGTIEEELTGSVDGFA